MTEKAHLRRWHRLISQLLRARAASPSSPARALPSTRCFGPLGNSERLALERHVAGRPQPTHAPPGEASDEDPAG